MHRGEPVTVAAVRADAGGGSNTTILDEIRLAAARITAAALPEGAALPALDRIKALTSRNRSLLDENEVLKANLQARDQTIESLRNVIDSASSPKGVLLDRVMRLEEVMRARDEKAHAETKRLIDHAAAIVDRMPREGIKRVVETDPLLERRYQALLNDHARLIARYQRLASAYFDETGKDAEDLMER